MNFVHLLSYPLVTWHDEWISTKLCSIIPSDTCRQLLYLFNINLFICFLIEMKRFSMNHQHPIQFYIHCEARAISEKSEMFTSTHNYACNDNNWNNSTILIICLSWNGCSSHCHPSKFAQCINADTIRPK